MKTTEAKSITVKLGDVDLGPLAFDVEQVNGPDFDAVYSGATFSCEINTEGGGDMLAWVKGLRTEQPPLVLDVHRNSREDLLLLAAKVTGSTIGGDVAQAYAGGSMIVTGVEYRGDRVAYTMEPES